MKILYKQIKGTDNYEVWRDDRADKKVIFEWAELRMFAQGLEKMEIPIEWVPSKTE